MNAVARLPVAVEPICRLLASARCNLTNEKATQADIHAVLVEHLPAGFEVEREKRISPRDIPDFLIAGAVVVEVKIKRATLRETLAQIGRYAENPVVQAIIVASNRAMVLPGQLHGKPIRFVSLGRAWM